MHTWSSTNPNNTEDKLLCLDLKQKNINKPFPASTTEFFPAIGYKMSIEFSDSFTSNKNHLNLHYFVVPLW